MSRNFRGIILKKGVTNKRKLKEKWISVTENLTKARVEQLRKAREEPGFRKFLSVDGEIWFINFNDPNRV